MNSEDLIGIRHDLVKISDAEDVKSELIKYIADLDERIKIIAEDEAGIDV